MQTQLNFNPLATSPIVVHYGAGVDSTAMLVGMAQRGIRPDLILFADVGAEKPETLEYVHTINAWLEAHDMPQVTTVRRFGDDGTHGLKSSPTHKRHAIQHDGYTDLEGKCLANQTLPSLAYGGHTCSSVFKVDPQQRYLKTWQPAVDAWAAGLRVRSAIGFDCTPNEQKRTFRTTQHDSDQIEHWFPLQDWGWDRERCIEEIAGAGLPIPIKSACYFCPASKPWEILWLAARHPELFMRALEIERVAGDRNHTVEGLWRKSTKTRPGNWRAWAEGLGILEGDEIVMPADKILAMATEEPNANLIQIAA